MVVEEAKAIFCVCAPYRGWNGETGATEGIRSQCPLNFSISGGPGIMPYWPSRLAHNSSTRPRFPCSHNTRYLGHCLLSASPSGHFLRPSSPWHVQLHLHNHRGLIHGLQQPDHTVTVLEAASEEDTTIFCEDHYVTISCSHLYQLLYQSSTDVSLPSAPSSLQPKH